MTLSQAAAAPAGRYTALAQALHWLTGLLMFAILPIAWVMTALPEKSARAGPLFDLHKSIGVTIFALVVVRLVWRALHPPPPLTGEPAAIALAGKASHWLLYAVMVWMPVTGYVMSAAAGYPVRWFGLPLPGLPKDKALVDVMDAGHSLGQWAVYALVALHLAATAWHLWARRDAVLDRMLPAQTNAPRGL